MPEGTAVVMEIALLSRATGDPCAVDLEVEPPQVPGAPLRLRTRITVAEALAEDAWLGKSGPLMHSLVGVASLSVSTVVCSSLSSVPAALPLAASAWVELANATDASNDAVADAGGGADDAPAEEVPVTLTMTSFGLAESAEQPQASLVDTVVVDFALTPTMELLFRPRHMQVFRAMSRLLLRLRRARLVLNDSWFRMRHRDASATRRARGMTQASLCRWQLQVALAAIESYLQEDVINVGMARLQAELTESRDFRDVQDAVHHFTAQILIRGLLTHTSALESVLDLIVLATRITSAGDRLGVDEDSTLVARRVADDMQHIHLAVCNLLEVMRSSRALRDRDPFAVVDLRLNFNEFFG